MTAYAPGRVNIIGDHTDYNAGLALPMAIDLGTKVVFEPDDSRRIFLRSSAEADPADVRLDPGPDEIRSLEPPWARYVSAIIGEVRPRQGGSGTVDTTLPVGAGLSSSASFEVALALALGVVRGPLALAKMCQRAETVATGVAAGLMDQLVACAATEGRALLIDFSGPTWREVAIPEGFEFIVVDTGQRRTLAHSRYATRRSECEEAATLAASPLGCIDEADLDQITDPVLRRRARHVVTECQRVRRFVGALERSDREEAGRLMNESHLSLSEDFDVSTDRMDDLARKLADTDGIFGARMTGAGFGGCLVALAEPGSLRTDELSSALRCSVRRVIPAGAASIRLPC